MDNENSSTILEALRGTFRSGITYDIDVKSRDLTLLCGTKYTPHVIKLIESLNLAIRFKVSNFTDVLNSGCDSGVLIEFKDSSGEVPINNKGTKSSVDDSILGTTQQSDNARPFPYREWLNADSDKSSSDNSTSVKYDYVSIIDDINSSLGFEVSNNLLIRAILSGNNELMHILQYIGMNHEGRQLNTLTTPRFAMDIIRSLRSMGYYTLDNTDIDHRLFVDTISLLGRLLQSVGVKLKVYEENRLSIEAIEDLELYKRGDKYLFKIMLNGGRVECPLDLSSLLHYTGSKYDERL